MKKMTERNYNNGKIYKIKCNITNNVYIGSTVTKLESRLKRHINDKKTFGKEQ